MRYRRFGRRAGRFPKSATACGAWAGGQARTTKSRDDRSIAPIELGCNFFDTAYAYGMGRSEKLLGDALERHSGRKLYTATKVPPKNLKWPGRADTPIADVFPYDYILEMTEKSLANLGVERRSISSSFTYGTTRG